MPDTTLKTDKNLSFSADGVSEGSSLQSKAIHQEFKNVVSFINPFLDFQLERSFPRKYLLYKKAYPDMPFYPYISRRQILFYPLNNEVLMISLNPDAPLFQAVNLSYINSRYIRFIKNKKKQRAILESIVEDLKEKYHLSEKDLTGLYSVLYFKNVQSPNGHYTGLLTAFQVLENTYLTALLDNQAHLYDIKPVITEERIIIAKRGSDIFKIDLNTTPILEQKLNLETMAITPITKEEKSWLKNFVHTNYPSRFDELNLGKVFSTKRHPQTPYFDEEQKQIASRRQKSTSPIDCFIRVADKAFQEELKKTYFLDSALNNSIFQVNTADTSYQSTPEIIIPVNPLPKKEKQVKPVSTKKQQPREVQKPRNSYDENNTRSDTPVSDLAIRANVPVKRSAMRSYNDSELSSDTSESIALNRLMVRLAKEKMREVSDNITKIQELLTPFLKRRLDDNDLLIPISQIPQQKYIILHNSAWETLIPGTDSKLCNSFYYQLFIITMYARFSMPPKQFYGDEDLLKAETEPFLCKNHILYQKKGRYIYKISLNKNHPLFLMKDIKTKKQFVMPLKEVTRIINEWNISQTDKVRLIDDLQPLYEKYLSNPNAYKEQQDNLPNFREVYTLFTLKHEWLDYVASKTTLSMQNRYERTNNDIEPTLTSEGFLVTGSQDMLHKINLLNGVSFEELRQHSTGILTPRDMNNIIRNIEQYKSFSSLTSTITPLIQNIYNQTIHHLFQALNNPCFIEICTKENGEQALSFIRDTNQDVYKYRDRVLLKAPQSILFLKKISSNEKN